MRIAFLGLGRMGSALVRHVIDAGHEVTVWNRTAAAAEDAVSRGARLADSPAEAIAGAEAVVTMFFGPDVTRKVILAPDTPFDDGTLWLDATTIAPADADEFAAWAQERGVRYVHIPVIGSVGPAREGALTALIGGPQEAVAAARPIVELWADPQKVRELGAARLAAAGKLIANLGVAVLAEGTVEALRLGHAAGFATDEVLGLLPLTQLAAQANVKAPIIAAHSWSEVSQFSVDALAKDTGFMLDVAERPLPAVAAFAALLHSAQADGLGEADFIAAARDDV